MLATHDAVTQQAGFAQALHDALAAQIPAQQPALDAALAATLDALPPGQAKSSGVSAGAAQATRLLADRNGDGLDVASVNSPWTPPATGPGVWQPTAPTYGAAIRAGQGRARPFLLASNDQFDPGPPPSRTSATYLNSLAEVRAYGSADSTARTATQTDTALFWEPATNLAFVQLLRGILAHTTEPLSWDARLVASFHVVTADAQIAVYNAKYKYVAWRPETAIHADPANPDASWTSFFAAPLHPEYPSGHAGYGGAAETVLTAFLGPDVPGSIAVTSTTAPGSTHTWTTFRAITAEIVNARVWEGVHFRFSDDTGAAVGRQVAGWDVSQLHRIGL